jgi:hypothetical protein
MDGSMRIHLVYIGLFCLLALGACKRVTVSLDKVPKNTPKGAQIFITGSFNNWNPGDPNYVMQFDEVSQQYSVNLPVGFGNIEYKFTRGDWTTVETDPCGGEYANRKLSYASTDFKADTIEGWQDLDPENCERVTLVIDKLPSNTPAKAKVYLGGNINGWNCTNDRFLFTSKGNGPLTLMVPRNSDKLVFKITRGTWESAELNETGSEQMQREVVFGQQDTVHLSINAWADMPLERIFHKTIVVGSLPKNLGKTDLFLACNLNNWNPLDGKYKFAMSANGKRYINVSYSSAEPFTYKITRGGWETVETDLSFDDIENRELTSSDRDTVYVHILAFADQAPERVKARSAPDRPIATIKKMIPVPAPSIKPPAVVAIQPLDYDKRKKVFIIIERMPDFGKGNTMYLAGDVNGWNDKDDNFQFRNLPNGKKYILLRLDDNGQHEFKITRGSWDREEANMDGTKPGNRIIRAKPGDDTIRVYIQRWFDEVDQKQLVLVLTETPVNTPPNESLYLSGNFNDWAVREEAYRFKKLPDGRYLLTITDFSKRYVYYKISRGSWDTEAATKTGRVPGNQQFKLGDSDTLKIRIERWKDL